MTITSDPATPPSPLDELATRVLTVARIATASVLSGLLFTAVTVGGIVTGLPQGLVIPIGLVIGIATVWALLTVKAKPMRLRGLRLLRDDPRKVAFIVAVGRAPRARGGAWYIALTDANGRLLAPALRLRDSKVVDEAVHFASQLAPAAKTAKIQDDTGVRPIEGMAGEAVERHAG
ncbi:MAG TPA: hypothetical protein VLB44_03520 [Kofleriaceae bacterium]|nr:hypothetical protein [Kofleriaceae bacterium]